MSLITRCPACETLFKVVPDQLRISDGWVRCGQCDEIFDASLHLLPPAPAPDAALPAIWHEELAAQPADATDGWQGAPAPLDIDLDADPLGRSVDLLLKVEPLRPVAAAEDRQRTAPEPISLDSSMPAGDAIALPQPAADDAEAACSAELNEVSFLRGDRPTSFWQQQFMRATLLGLGLALLLGLAAQVLLHERDRLVAIEPGLQPWLLALCRPFNCRLSPLRGIDAIVIDSSSFSKIRGGAYRLNFALKNSATTPLAVPAMELTLTDALDQAVVRRVLGPAELGAPSDTLGAGAEWSASVALAVQAGGPAERVAGYRLLAFYP